ncbi:hypothetical protein V496_07913, partial [Pseudogymnoascus sp. VKM F-4515 (FW-2607)]
MRAPQRVGLFPLLLGEQLAAGLEVKVAGQVGRGVDGEVCVAEDVGPFVVYVGDDEREGVGGGRRGEVHGGDGV